MCWGPKFNSDLEVHRLHPLESSFRAFADTVKWQQMSFISKAPQCILLWPQVTVVKEVSSEAQSCGSEKSSTDASLQPLQVPATGDALLLPSLGDVLVIYTHRSLTPHLWWIIWDTCSSFPFWSKKYPFLPLHTKAFRVTPCLLSSKTYPDINVA